jgi:hypothetical protein
VFGFTGRVAILTGCAGFVVADCGTAFADCELLAAAPLPQPQPLPELAPHPLLPHPPLVPQPPPAEHPADFAPDAVEATGRGGDIWTWNAMTSASNAP